MPESTSSTLLKCIRCLSGPRLREGARNTLAVGLEKGRSRGTVLYWRQRCVKWTDDAVCHVSTYFILHCVCHFHTCWCKYNCSVLLARWLDLLGKWPGFEAGQSAWIPGTSLRPLTVGWLVHIIPLALLFGPEAMCLSCSLATDLLSDLRSS
uniref:Uncharacterized protein MANES_05G070100 n=1 Tax=Rhizophora mucronata TaxID=61149 RepID=A0A2P2MGG8_RHIMU